MRRKLENNRVRRLASVLGLAAAIATAAVYLSIEPPRLNDAEASPDTPPVAPPPALEAADDVDLGGFLRGNVHVHTWMSDGDSDPQTVAAWYAEHGYDFVAITDHNRYGDDTRLTAPDGFLILPGEEVTMAATGKPVHVNALCTERTIGGGTFKSRPQALSWAVTQIRAQGGVALVNHPNFAYALETEHIAAGLDAHLLDVFNGHPQVHNAGDATHDSVESKWQALLDRGIKVAPAAVDDAHMFAASPTEGIPSSRPGTGWIGVAATARSVQGVCEALRKGHVYASSGAELSRIRVADGVFEVWMSSSRAKVEMIGRGGAVLATVSPRTEAGGWVARYVAQPNDGLVRARVSTPTGQAWTPAFHLTR